MKIVMVGCGAAGSVFASYLRLGGADITLVDRYKAHMDKVAKDGMRFVIYPDRECQIDGFKTTCEASEAGIADVVIIVTKSTQRDSAIETAKPCIGPDTVVLSLMNGLGNDEALMKVVPAERAMIGCGALGTQLPEPGKCISTEIEGVLMHFGAVKKSPRTDEVGEYLAKCFTDGGCLAKYEQDIYRFIWTKVIINSTVNTVCAVLRMKICEVAADPYGLKLFHDVAREGCAVATAKGVTFEAEEFIDTALRNFIENMGDYYPSMAQDLLIKKVPTEISTLNAKIAEYGAELGIPTPVNAVLSDIVSAMHENYDKLYKD